MKNLLLCRVGTGIVAAALAGAFVGCDDDDDTSSAATANATANTDAGASGGDSDAGVSAASVPAVFAPVDAASTDETKRQVYASESATINGTTTQTGFVTLLRSGEQKGDNADLNTFGLVVDKDLKPILAEDGSPTIADSNDFSSLLKVGEKLYSIAQFEDAPGAVYLTELAQDSSTGALSAVSTKAVDLSGINGIWTPCAGQVTPWSTHLGSEEYEPDAAKEGSADDMQSFLGTTPANPYFYGFPVEYAVSEAGDVTVTKHYSLGRFAHELSYVLPNQKTVYEADDGTNVGFYRYEATTAGDLTGGTLYAAKWNQTSAKGGSAGEAAADISCIELGTATDAEIKALIDGGITFADIFDSATAAADGTCATGYTVVVANSKDVQCLKLKAGQEKAAAFLETRRYAAYLGATIEFRKEEGITFDAENKKLYVAYSEINNGASDDKGDVQLAETLCGAVIEYDLDDNYVATAAKGVVVGTEHEYAEGETFYGNACDIDGIGNPDNISFLPGQKTLLIGEDATEAHANDVAWAYNIETKELTRIASTPYGSETTSLYYYPNFNGFGYVVFVVQHPYGEDDLLKESKTKVSEDSADRRSYFGYIGALAPAAN